MCPCVSGCVPADACARPPVLVHSDGFKKEFSKLTASISIITTMRLLMASLFLVHYCKNAFEGGFLQSKVALLRHAQEAIESDPSKGEVICYFCYVRATRTGGLTSPAFHACGSASPFSHNNVMHVWMYVCMHVFMCPLACL